MVIRLNLQDPPPPQYELPSSKKIQTAVLQSKLLVIANPRSITPYRCIHKYLSTVTVRGLDPTFQQSNSFGMALPYNLHPIYGPRITLLITASTSLLLVSTAILSGIAAPWNTDPLGLWLVHTIFVILSIALCAYDLRRWAKLKAADPDEDPEWPLKRIMIGDIVLALFFWFLWVTEMDLMPYSSRTSILHAYTSFTALIISALHGFCLWKELMVLKDNWLASYACRCVNVHGGHHSTVSADIRGQGDLLCRREQSSETPCRCNDASYANKQDIDIEALARSSESACLVTPNTDDNMGYQSLNYGAVGYGHVKKQELSVECDIDEEEEVQVVRKKKRAGKDVASRSRGRGYSR